MRNSTHLSALLATLLLLVGCEKSSNNISTQSWEAFTERFAEVYFRERLNLAQAEVNHDYNDQLASFRPKELQRKIGRMKAARRAARAYDEYALTPEQRFEREYLLALIEDKLLLLEMTKGSQPNPNYDTPHRAPSYPPGQLASDSPLARINDLQPQAVIEQTSIE